ncbi:MAG TPA: hypothetical protein VM600_00865 [Actinomycetota bacterium]|nr:hypothetical protein [Actinomycetota bacterium]
MAQSAPNHTLQEPDPVRRPARLALYLGAALILAGIVALYLGYDGAATNPLPQAQTPYVISGGLLGLGLMALGGVTIAVYVLLQVQGDLRSELGAMRESMDRLSEVIAHEAFSSASKSATPSSNGTVMVARGAASFHRADCRLVVRAEGVTPLPREEADRTGLVPCRICKP